MVRLVVCALVLSAWVPDWGAAKTWRRADIDGMVVFSNARESRTEKLVEELRDADEAFRAVFPGLRGDSATPLRVVVCDDAKSMNQIVPVFGGRPGMFGGLFARDQEGAFVLINASKGFDAARHAVYHEYIHFLTISRDTYMPAWLAEGLAELFATVETDRRGRVEVGHVLPGRLRVIREQPLMPLERFFGVTRVSPEYTSGDHGRGLFYAQSWLLLHYLFQEPKDLNPGAKRALMELASSKPFFSEEEFRAAVGVGYDGMERLLNRYALEGSYTVRTVALGETDERDPVALREMSEGEVSLLMGSIRLRTRGPRDAYGSIVRGFEAMPNSAEAAAYRGYYSLAQDDFEFAAKYLGLAVERGSKSPATHVNFALAMMRARNPRNSLSPRRYDRETTEAVFSVLEAARSLAGPFSPELYHRYGEVLLGTRVDTDVEDFSILVEGTKAYPSDDRIAYYLAVGMERQGELESALSLVEEQLRAGFKGQLFGHFEDAKLRIEVQLGLAE